MPWRRWRSGAAPCAHLSPSTPQVRRDHKPVVLARTLCLGSRVRALLLPQTSRSRAHAFTHARACPVPTKHDARRAARLVRILAALHSAALRHTQAAPSHLGGGLPRFASRCWLQNRGEPLLPPITPLGAPPAVRGTCAPPRCCSAPWPHCSSAALPVHETPAHQGRLRDPAPAAGWAGARRWSNTPLLCLPPRRGLHPVRPTPATTSSARARTRARVALRCSPTHTRHKLEAPTPPARAPPRRARGLAPYLWHSHTFLCTLVGSGPPHEATFASPCI